MANRDEEKYSSKELESLASTIKEKNLIIYAMFGIHFLEELKFDPYEIVVAFERVTWCGVDLLDSYGKGVYKFFMILYRVEFEDLPLLVRDEESLISIVASWRLLNGK